MRILYLGAHSILEHDDLRLFHSLGHEVFSLGGYIDPAAPHDPKRPALPWIPAFPELRAVVDAIGAEDNLDAAKVHVPDELLDWADLVMVAAFEWRWLVPQWKRLRDKRVVWRTIGQSGPRNEALVAPLFRDGLEIVRYSPKERTIPGYAGETAVIRFYKDPDEWSGWTGDRTHVLNITQHLRQRGDATNWRFWEQATRGLARCPMGPGSEAIDGTGEVSVERMQEALRRARCYLYTGTQPASYTLGLIEALMTGTPVISIGPRWMASPELFEGHELAGVWTNDAFEARRHVARLLESSVGARQLGQEQRERAIALFGMDTIAEQWARYLDGVPSSTVQGELEAVPA